MSNSNNVALVLSRKSDRTTDVVGFEQFTQPHRHVTERVLYLYTTSKQMLGRGAKMRWVRYATDYT